MKNNVITFKNARKSTRDAAAALREARDNVVSMTDWKGRVRARRTASGVFFTTGVLVSPGHIA